MATEEAMAAQAEAEPQVQQQAQAQGSEESAVHDFLCATAALPPAPHTPHLAPLPLALTRGTKRLFGWAPPPASSTDA